MLRAIGICVLIGWAFGIATLVGTGKMTGPYDVATAFGMGLVPAILGSLIALSRRRTKEFAGAYITTSVVAALIAFGSIYGARSL